MAAKLQHKSCVGYVKMAFIVNSYGTPASKKTSKG